jgi:hypothetical protein
MARQTRWWGAGVLGMSGWLLAGCAQLPDYAVPTRSFAQDISRPGDAQSRAQMADGPQRTKLSTPQPLQLIPAVGTNATKPPIEQTSFANRGIVSCQVRAWVNGRPIFEAEVMQQAGPDLNKLAPGMSAAEATKRIAEIRDSAIEHLIDQEVIYQEFVKMIEKRAPHMFEKLKEFVDQECDKTVERMQKAGAPDKAIR